MEKKFLASTIAYMNKNEYMMRWHSIFTNRFYIIRKWLFKNIKKFSHYITWDVLDFGCWYKPYKEMFQNITSYTWVDFTWTKWLYNSADVYYDWDKLSFDDNHFDSFICTEVLEHVFNIDVVLHQLHRVLKQWGYWIITMPFARDEHEQPYDFGRYTSFWVNAIFPKNWFEIIEYIKAWTYIQAIWQLSIMYYIKISFSRFHIINLINRVTIIPLMNLFYSVLSSILPKNYDLYLNHIIVIQKK